MESHNTSHILGSLHLALSGNQKDDWYIAFSRDENRCLEGSWQEWVDFARAILAQEKM